MASVRCAALGSDLEELDDVEAALAVLVLAYE